MWPIAKEEPLGIVLKRTARGDLLLGWVADDHLSQQRNSLVREFHFVCMLFFRNFVI